MKYSFAVYRMENAGDYAWVAESKELEDCLGVGNTQEEAVASLAENEAVWLEMAKEDNRPIPRVEIKEDVSYSGKLTLRFSPREHELAAKRAEVQGVSLNQYISDAVVAYSHESKALSAVSAIIGHLGALIQDRSKVVVNMVPVDKLYPSIPLTYSNRITDSGLFEFREMETCNVN